MMERVKKNKTEIFLIVIVLLAFLVKFMYLRLKEPVYMQRESEVLIYHKNGGYYIDSITLDYATNFYSNKEIDTITLVDNNGDRYKGTIDYEPNKNYDRFYKFYSGYYVFEYEKDSYPPEGTFINKARITYTSGDEQVADIGEMTLYNNTYYPYALKAEGSSGDFRRNDYSVQQQFKLIDVKSPLYEKYDDNYELLINDEPYTESIDEVFRENESFNIELKTKGNNYNTNPVVKKDFNLKLTIEDSNGKQFNFYIELADASSNRTYEAVRRIVKGTMNFER